jgi:PKD repeat protein
MKIFCNLPEIAKSMKNKIYSLSILLIALTIWISGNAQLTVVPGGSAFQMGDALTGNGVTIQGNPTINCNPLSYGAFANGGSTNLGISNGIVLTTGNAQGMAGANNNTSYGVDNGVQFSDPHLTSIVPQANRDVCALELDIIPQCDTLTIRFVFGSDEYMEFVNEGYNDAFAFFIFGPNPAGGMYNAYNVARLPNNTVVSIDNVNANNNSTYYVDNTNGTQLQYDGRTVVLSPKIKVVPCQTYHFKLIIGDSGDGLIDSGVLIDFISCTNALNATANVTPSDCGMDNGTVTITTNGGDGPFDYDWSFNQTLSGPTANNLAPGSYSVEIEDLGISCATPITIDFTIPEDGPIPQIALYTDDNSPCLGDTVAVWGVCDTTFSWLNTNYIDLEGDTAFFVIGDNNQFEITATNLCGSNNAVLNLNSITSPSANILNDEFYCHNEPLILSGEVATGPGNFSWTTPNGGTLNGLTHDLGNAQFSMNGMYYLATSFEDCPVKLDSVLITVIANPTNNINNAAICPGQSLDVLISPNTTYTWNNTVGASISPNGNTAQISPAVNTTYIVSNSYGCSTTINVVMNTIPEVLTNISDIQGCAPLSVQFTDINPEILNFNWQFGDGQSSINESPLHVFEGGSMDTSYQVTLTVQNAQGCTNTAFFTIQTMMPAVAEFTLDPISQTFPNSTVNVDNQSSGSGTLSSTWQWQTNTTQQWQPGSLNFNTWGEFQISLITQNEWCSDTSIQSIQIIPPAPIASFDLNFEGCPGSTFNFSHTSIYAQSIEWIFGDGDTIVADSPSHTYNNSGFFNVTLLAHGYDGSTDTAIINNAVEIYPSPQAYFNLLETTIAAVVDSAVVINLSSGANAYTWNFGNGESSNDVEPNAYYQLVGQYPVTLVASNSYGCTDSYAHPTGITVTTDGFIDMPNAFSPTLLNTADGSYVRYDFSNNIFHPHFRSISEFEMTIFNKWGELLFITNDIWKGWNGFYQGQLCPEDVYVYTCKGKFFGGVDFETKGTVTLLIK